MGGNWIILAVVLLGLVCQGLAEQYDPCCSFPCQNNGVCVSGTYDSYTCDCETIPYYGTNCEIPTWRQWIYKSVKPHTPFLSWLLTNFRPFWTVFQSIKPVKLAFLRTFFMLKKAFVDSPPLYATDGHDYTTLNGVKNRTAYVLSLPPVPKNCPTPMGVKGKAQLPPPKEVVEKLFKRKEFIPNSIGSNVLFGFMAQHFTHQFFKTSFEKGPGYTWSAQEVDSSHVYGKNKEVEHILRSHVDGKMKMQMINGEDYPPYLKDAPVEMNYPPELYIPEDRKFAMGHRFFSLMPGLFLYQTIWLREHNRVCGILKEEHPQWDDERLFQTAKLIIIAESLKVIIEDYLRSISNYHLLYDFDPTIFHGQVFNYANRIFVEHNHLYHWHQLMPDEFHVDDVTYPMGDFMYHSELVIKHGTRNFTAALAKQRAGEITLRNHGPSTHEIVERVIQHGRDLRLQPFNQYRQRFGLPALKSIDELTDNEEYRQILKDMYGDIDGVELFVGLMAENRRPKGMFGVTLYDLVGPYSIKGLFSAPVCTPEFWKPSTFGGDVGFNIVKSASLQRLFCTNMPGDCPYIAFRVPEDMPENNLRYKQEL